MILLLLIMQTKPNKIQNYEICGDEQDGLRWNSMGFAEDLVNYGRRNVKRNGQNPRIWSTLISTLFKRNHIGKFFCFICYSILVVNVND